MRMLSCFHAVAITRSVTATLVAVALLSACGGGGADEPALSNGVEQTNGASTEGAASHATKLAAAVAVPRRYSFTDLGTLGGAHSSARAINNAGQVVGCAHTSGNKVHAALWEGSTAVDLDHWDGLYSCANDINNAGQIVGESHIAGNNQIHATLWSGSTATDLGAWAYGSGAASINDQGRIVGWSYTGQDTIYRATLWAGTAMVDLGVSSGNTHSRATSVNNAGQIIGWSETTFTADPHATAWRHGTALDLGHWNYSAALDLNETGQIVGYGCGTFPYAGPCTAVSWQGSAAVELSPLGEEESIAYAINNASQIVGSSYTCDSSGRCVHRATLWEGDTAVDLNSLLAAGVSSAGWSLQSARDINDAGSIAGDAINTLTGANRAFVLTPLKDKDQCRKDGWRAFDFSNEAECLRFLKRT